MKNASYIEPIISVRCLTLYYLGNQVLLYKVVSSQQSPDSQQGERSLLGALNLIRHNNYKAQESAILSRASFNFGFASILFTQAQIATTPATAIFDETSNNCPIVVYPITPQRRF